MNKEKMIEVINIKTKKVSTVSPRQLAKQIVKTPELLPLYTYKIVDDPRRVYSFECWIHPKSGGDDYMTGYDVSALSEKDACVSIEKTLKRKSAITSDYILTHVNGKEVMDKNKKREKGTYILIGNKKVKVEEVVIDKKTKKLVKKRKVGGAT